jgi:hypothetical protein
MSLIPTLKKNKESLFIKESKLKNIKDVIACVVDYGTFISIADKLSETMKIVYYYSPFEEEYQNAKECLKATGLDKVIRCNNPLQPEILSTIDLFVFPDIGFAGMQNHLKSIGKAVWGNNGASELELDRAKFLDTIKKVGLPVIKYEKIIGLDALDKYLKTVKDKWVKISRYRANMETWHHIDYEHSKRRIDHFNVVFGPIRNELVFIVQDNIESDLEVGYDGWCIDGKYPSQSFQGYEKKNQLYLGCVMSNNDIPKEIKLVNQKLSPVLKEYGYRNWWATEIRIINDIPYFIDPTPRMPGQTGEHQLESIENFSDIIWFGSNGILIEPKFKWKYAAEATLHYDASDKDILTNEQWKTLDIPKEVRKWVKLYHYCKIDDIYHFFPSDIDEVGVVIGFGNTIEESINNLKENAEVLKDLPLHIDTYGFIDLLKQIKEAEKKGIKFGDSPIPNPELIIES